MRLLIDFLDEWNPHIDHPNLSVHEDPRLPDLRSLRKNLFLTQIDSLFNVLE
jgi:magnesium chelatase subunit I